MLGKAVLQVNFAHLLLQNNVHVASMKKKMLWSHLSYLSLEKQTPRKSAVVGSWQVFEIWETLHYLSCLQPTPPAASDHGNQWQWVCITYDCHFIESLSEASYDPFSLLWWNFHKGFSQFFTIQTASSSWRNHFYFSCAGPPLLLWEWLYMNLKMNRKLSFSQKYSTIILNVFYICGSWG